MSGSNLTVGLLTALIAPELVNVEQFLVGRGWALQQPAPGQGAVGISVYEKDNVTLYLDALGEAGQARAGVETMIFLERCERKPNIVILCGIAGSLDEKKYQKRDVVVGSTLHWRTPDKVMSGDPCAAFRWKTFAVENFDMDVRKDLHKRVVRLFPKQTAEQPFSVHFGEIYTGNYVVSSNEAVRHLNETCPEACCVEMEAGGFNAALSRYSKVMGDRGTIGIVVRGISDYAVNKDKDPSVRADASANAALVAVELVVDFYKDRSIFRALEKTI